MTTATLRHSTVRAMVNQIDKDLEEAKYDDKINVRWNAYANKKGVQTWVIKENYHKMSECKVTTFGKKGMTTKMENRPESTVTFRGFGGIRLSKADLPMFEEEFDTSIQVFDEELNGINEIYKILKASISSKKGVRFKLIGQSHWEVRWQEKK
tara:strand:- start:3254 stop:3712 length:459 start_codon:yes stop_codon:yes gene_type:complete